MTAPAEAPTAGRAGSGFGLILLATAIGGIAGYVITWLVPREIGFAAYAPFAVYWAFLFLVISALSGIQQEVTRATSTAAAASDSLRTFRLAAIIAGAVFALVVATAPLWVAGVFPESGWGLVWPLAVGAASYVGVAAVYGSLYGTGQWRVLFAAISTEALLRLAAVGMALALTSDLVAIAWAVAAPIPIALLVLSVPIHRAIHGRTALDVGLRRLGWNFARTVVAATSLGVLVSGLPLVIGLTSPTEPATSLGLLISVMTITRAPLIVVAMALQSYLIVQFRASGDRLFSLFARLSALVIAIAAVLAVAGYLVGPAVFSWLFPEEQTPQAWLVACLVGSSALVGLLCISAPAVLSLANHMVYSLGWLAAAIVTIVCLLLPLEFHERTLVALFAGPVAGLLVHTSYLVAARLGARREISERSASSAPGASPLS